MNLKKVLLGVLLLIIVTPLIYSVVWIALRDRIITHFGGNSFSTPEFPRIGQYVTINFPSAFATGYVLKAEMKPVSVDNSILPWWEDNHIEQWRSSFKTGYTVHVTEHSPSPFQNDNRYSYEEMTREAPAYLICKIADNHLLEGRSVEFQILSDSTLLGEYKLKILQPQSEGFKKFRAWQNMFRFSLKMLIGITLLILLLYWLESRLFVLAGIGVIIIIFLIVTTPGKAKFESYGDHQTRKSGKLSEYELIEVDNYILFSVGSFEITHFKKDQYPLVSHTQESTFVGFFGGISR